MCLTKIFLYVKRKNIFLDFLKGAVDGLGHDIKQNKERFL